MQLRFTTFTTPLFIFLWIIFSALNTSAQHADMVPLRSHVASSEGNLSTHFKTSPNLPSKHTYASYLMILGGGILIALLILGGNAVIQKEKEEKKPKLLSFYRSAHSDQLTVIISFGETSSFGRLYLTSMDDTKHFVCKVGNGIQEVDISGFAEGMYIITVEDSNGASHSQRFNISTEDKKTLDVADINFA